MPRIPVRAGRGRIVWALVDEQDAGWVCARSWRLNNRGYVIARVYAGKRKGKSRHRDQTMHRMLMGLERGDPLEVDHVDRDRLNNCRSNLRVLTHPEQSESADTPGECSEPAGP